MSAPTLKHLQMKDVNGVAVIDFMESGLMFEATLIHEIGEELHSLLIDHGRSRILLDFTHVRYLSSSMLGQLARLARDVESAFVRCVRVCLAWNPGSRAARPHPRPLTRVPWVVAMN